MKTEWLKNDTITLRSPEPEDLELLYKMENDPDMWSTGNATLPYSRYTLRRYLEESKQDIFTERQARFIIELSNGASAGMIDLADFCPINNRAEVCIGILSEYRKQGIGYSALKLLTEYAKEILHLHQLYAYIQLDNTASRRLFTSIGFEEAATLKEWQRNGNEYKDVVITSLKL